eukprot:11227535-Alexandrium_andersonii.AAC.1
MPPAPSPSATLQPRPPEVRRPEPPCRCLASPMSALPGPPSPWAPAPKSLHPWQPARRPR